MATAHRALAAIALVAAATAAAAAQPLKPQWSRPVGGKTRFVGVEEYGRCSVFVDNGVIQVVASSGEISWTWPLAKISKFKPEKVAVSHECDAIAFVGDATYKSVWVAQKTGKSVTLKLNATPAEVCFDRTGQLIALGTFSGSLLLYSLDGELQWQRDTRARIVQGMEFSDDNQRIAFRSFAGAGVVSVAGHVESSTQVADDDVALSADAIECADGTGRLLSRIDGEVLPRNVLVSRDFAQVLVIRDKDLTPVMVERYEVPKPCRP